MKATNITNYLSGGPGLDAFNFCGVNLNTISKHNIAKKGQIVGEKCALLKVDINLLSLRVRNTYLKCIQ